MNFLLSTDFVKIYFVEKFSHKYYQSVKFKVWIQIRTDITVLFSFIGLKTLLG